MRRGLRNKESGAVALVFALVTVLLFAVAALGVDLGNAFNRKRELQGQVDLAALAGGAALPVATTTPSAGDDAVKAVADYLVTNQVGNDNGVPMPSANTLATYLVDPAKKDTWGQVYYGSFDAEGSLVPDTDMLTVVGPRTQVDFGFGAAVGVSDTKIQAKATVVIKSPGSVGATLPFYAYNGCDWGEQIISQPTSNPAAPGVALSAKKDITTSLSVTDSEPPFPNASITVGGVSSEAHLDVGDKTTTVSVSGTNLDKALFLGFFLDDGDTYYKLPKSAFVSQTPTNITLNLADSAVANVIDDTNVWYLRASDSVSGTEWTDVSSNQAYLSVGDATLYCRGGKNSGNFGSLTIARDDSNNGASNGWLPRNIAIGIQVPKVTLAVYAAAIDSGSCDTGDPDAIFSDTSPNVGSNCLTTDPGFPQNPATNGLITGVSGTPNLPGHLAQGTPGCGNALARDALSVSINNEVLSCYFTDTSTKVSTVSSRYYDGLPLIDASIYSSPRFFWIPVLTTQPANGKKTYPIVDFRAAFMTGESGDSTKVSNDFVDDATTNGVAVAQHHIDSLRVVFINPKALPPVPGNGRPIDYTGSGATVLVLSN